MFFFNLILPFFFDENGIMIDQITLHPINVFVYR